MKTMKMKKILIISVFIICYSTPIFARYYESLEYFSGKATIAEPIIKVENLQNTISMEINKEENIKEYKFVVKNYEVNNGKKRISEVDFLYDIEIRNSNNNFPVRYELFECETEEELLKGTNKIQNLEILKNVEYEKEYRLKVIWETKENMSDINDVDIVVTASQKKG